MHYDWECYEQQRTPGNWSEWLIEGQPGYGYTETLFFEGFQPTTNHQTHREEGVVGPGF
jgi:hypothetical protein